MDFHDLLYCFNGGLSLVGTKGFLMVNSNVWLAHIGMAHEKSGMGSFGNVHQFGDTSFISSTPFNWIQETGWKGGKTVMELLTLFVLCFGIFSFFVLSEVIKLKKEVNKLNGIVKHLLEKNDAKQNQNN